MVQKENTMIKTTAISVAGDKTYVNAVTAIAARFGVRQGDIVRDALDKVYGKEIGEQLVFFAESVNQIHQLKQLSSVEE